MYLSLEVLSAIYRNVTMVLLATDPISFKLACLFSGNPALAKTSDEQIPLEICCAQIC